MKMYMKDTREEVKLEIVCTFEDDDKRKFVVLTDGSKHEDGRLNIYPYYFEKDGEDVLLSPINEEDIYLVDEAFKKIEEENK